MEIGPIIRSLIYNKGRFWLIVVEIALTLAVVANCLNVIRDHSRKINRPTGMDVENLLVIESQPFAPEFQQKEYVENAFRADLQALRALPGVRSASATHAIPLSGGGSATGRKTPDSEDDTTTAPYFIVTEDILETLGVELAAGRDFVPEDFPDPLAERPRATPESPDHSNVIVTQAMADRLFPDGDALGRQMQNKSGTDVDTIVGIVRQMHGSWPLSNVVDRVVLFPGNPASERRARYLVRAEPGMVDSLYTGVEEELLRVNDGRILEIHTLAEIKSDYYASLGALNKLFGSVSLLLILVTSLGMFGLTSFSVAQRRRQIGTRRALGATRRGILRYFLVENWVVTAAGLTIGLVLTYGLNYLLAQVADGPTMPWPLVLGGMALLWSVGLMAALLPALRGTAVPPVVATRTV